MLLEISSLLPSGPELTCGLTIIGAFALVLLLLGGIIRALLGKGTQLNEAISAVAVVLCIYALTALIYSYDLGLSAFLAPLPFVSFQGDSIRLFAFADADWPRICRELLSMILLAFPVNLLNSLLPRGKGLCWCFWRILTVLGAMALHFIACWILNSLPADLLGTYAPMILLGCLIAMVLLGALKLILGLALTVIHPIIGLAYSIFFSNLIGRQLSKAVVTTALAAGLFLTLDHFEITEISLAFLP